MPRPEAGEALAVAQHKPTVHIDLSGLEPLFQHAPDTTQPLMLLAYEHAHQQDEQRAGDVHGQEQVEQEERERHEQRVGPAREHAADDQQADVVSAIANPPTPVKIAEPCETGLLGGLFGKCKEGAGQ